MSQTLKSVLGMLVILGGIGGITWLMQANPGETWIWWWRVGSALSVGIPSILLIREAFRKDLAPDYLHQLMGDYFERNGFCFAACLENADQGCQLELYFQNQYEGFCKAVVWLVPTKDVFVDRSGLGEKKFEIDCGPGAFGKVTEDISVPSQLKGETTRWDVTANVEYPQGRGRLLRYRNGMRVSASRESSPARILLKFPVSGTSRQKGSAPHRVVTLWQMGDAQMKT